MEETWKLIDSVPKDGTPVLLAYPWLGSHRRYIGTWSQAGGGWIEGDRPTGFHFNPRMQGGFTHWMPLPASPATTQKGG